MASGINLIEKAPPLTPNLHLGFKPALINSTSEKAKKVAGAIIFGILALLSLFLPPLLALPSFALFTSLSARLQLEIAGTQNRPAPSQFSHEISLPFGALDDKPYQGIATTDAVESQKWRLKMIENAEKSVLLLGCYGGGKALFELLDVLSQEMEKKPNLTATIAISEVFATEETKNRLATLEKTFRPRFSALVHSEVFPYFSPKTKRLSFTTNHTKALIIDYGALFMVGGSGVASCWTENRGDIKPKRAEKISFLYDSFGAKSYRDADFIFQSPEGNRVGGKLHQEMVYLVERLWNLKGQKRFGSLIEKPGRYLYSKPIFPFGSALTPGLKIAFYATGPDDRENLFFQHLKEEIKKAKELIVIDHLYFHPDQELFDALSSAIQRGVQVTLITNEYEASSPPVHATFSGYSRYSWKRLMQGDTKSSFSVYQFKIANTTLHKKVIVIDGKLSFLGSSNIGLKSMQDDFEINFKVESQAFARSILDTVKKDIILSEKVLANQAPFTPLDNLHAHLYPAMKFFL